MDLKQTPPPQPQQPMAPQAPTPQVDPFVSDPPIVPVTSGKVKKSKGGILKKLLLVLLVILLIAGTGYGVYAWQQQNVDKLTKENQALLVELETKNTKITDLEAEATKDAVKPTTDELVITSVTNYCQSSVDPTTKKALVYTQGTSKDKKVLYSADKKFAYVNAGCAPTANVAGSSRGYYLKLTDNQWVVLYQGVAVDPVATKLYDIPAEFN